MFMPPVTVCRPAMPYDKAAVLELTRTIWRGNDYVPYVWDHWLADPRGLLVTAEYKGQVGGLVKLTQMSAAQFWMEGLRVAYPLRGLGLASSMHEYLLALWQKWGGTAIRLMTSYRRVRVHHLCDKHGFTLVNKMQSHTALPLADRPAPFKTLGAGDAAAALAALQANPLIPLTGPLLDLGWKFADPEAEIIENMLAQGHLLSWRGGQGLAAVFVDEDEGNLNLMLAAAACAPEDFLALLEDLRRLCAERACGCVYWQPACQPELLALIAGAGFAPTDEDQVFLYEKKRY